MADNGCQPTSLAFMRACAALGIRQAFTSYSNPKGNADTERFLRTLKEELVWLREWTSPAAFFASPRPLARRLQRQLSPFGARLPSAECRRSRASRPRHSLSRSLLNGEQYSGQRRRHRPPPVDRLDQEGQLRRREHQKRHPRSAARRTGRAPGASRTDTAPEPSQYRIFR